MKSIISFLICIAAVTASFGQDINGSSPAAAEMFKRISNAVKDFKPDTSDVPNDKITAKIIELRKLRGGFNINEAIAFKIEEDRGKKEIPAATLDKISNYFTSGQGKRLLDNAVIWTYRRHFTSRELSQLVKFYRSSAGQKMAADFPIIMLETIKAGDMVKEKFNRDSSVIQK